MRRRKIRVAVSGIPRGLHCPRSDGNWLSVEQLDRLREISSDLEIVEIPADKVGRSNRFDVLLAEGANRVHFPGELDWVDYLRFFTPRLKWVQLCSAGFSDNITDAMIDGSVILTNAVGIHSVALAESVIGAMLAHAKRLHARRDLQIAHRWQTLKNSELMGQVVTIVGLGNIGQRVAHLAKAFGMQVIGCKRRIELVDNVDEVFEADSLVRYLPKTDYLVMAVPLTEQTRNLVDAQAFALMKPNAYLINVARGATVNQAAMIEALRAGRIAGAFLDAHVDEPLASDSPVWDLPNTTVISHDSHSSPNIGDRLADLFAENLRRYMAGQPLINVCDVTRGY